MTTSNHKKQFTTLDLAYMAIGAVLIAVCAWITIPAAVPFTMQTFAVLFVLCALGGKRGTVSVLLYILLGAVGIPVFSGFGAGVGVLLGSTGGYIVGFVLAGLLYWLITGLASDKLWIRALAMLAGLAACYALGTVWFMVVYTRAKGAVSLGTVLSWCVIPFILPDLIKMALALLVANRVEAALKLR